MRLGSPTELHTLLKTRAQSGPGGERGKEIWRLGRVGLEPPIPTRHRQKQQRDTRDHRGLWQESRGQVEEFPEMD